MLESSFSILGQTYQPVFYTRSRGPHTTRQWKPVSNKSAEKGAVTRTVKLLVYELLLRRHHKVCSIADTQLIPVWWGSSSRRHACPTPSNEVLGKAGFQLTLECLVCWSKARYWLQPRRIVSVFLTIRLPTHSILYTPITPLTFASDVHIPLWTVSGTSKQSTILILQNTWDNGT